MRLLTAMADSCSSSSGEEEHAIMLGALAVLQQIDTEEKKEKVVGSSMDRAVPAVRCILCFNDGD